MRAWGRLPQIRVRDPIGSRAEPHNALRAFRLRSGMGPTRNATRNVRRDGSQQSRSRPAPVAAYANPNMGALPD
jgi:hypothetical protein